MPPPQLKYNGIQGFEEHALYIRSKYDYRTNRVAKPLVVNKTFLDVAGSRNVYRLSIYSYEPNQVSVSVHSYDEKYTYGACYLSIDNVRRILSLLKKALICILHVPKPNASETLALVELVEGRLGMRFYNDQQFETLKRFWQRLDMLSCEASLLLKMESIRPKPFDKLKIYSIKTLDEFHSALRQPTKQLELHFCETFQPPANSANLEFTNETKECVLKLYRNWNFNQVYQVVCQIKEVCAQLKQLDIIYLGNPCYRNQQVSITQTLDTIVQQHQSFVEFVQSICQLRLKSKVNVEFRTWIEGSVSFYPKSWLNLMQKTRTDLAQFEIKDKDGTSDYKETWFSAESKSLFCTTKFSSYFFYIPLPDAENL